MPVNRFGLIAGRIRGIFSLILWNTATALSSVLDGSALYLVCTDSSITNLAGLGPTWAIYPTSILETRSNRSMDP